MQKLGDLRKDRKAGAEIMQPRYSEAQPWPSAGEATEKAWGLELEQET